MSLTTSKHGDVITYYRLNSDGVRVVISKEEYTNHLNGESYSSRNQTGQRMEERSPKHIRKWEWTPGSPSIEKDNLTPRSEIRTIKVEKKQFFPSPPQTPPKKDPKYCCIIS